MSERIEVNDKTDENEEENPKNEEEVEGEGENVSLHPLLCYSMKYVDKEEDFFKDEHIHVFGYFSEKGLLLDEKYPKEELPVVKEVEVEVSSLQDPPCFQGSLRSPMKSVLVWRRVNVGEEKEPCFFMSRRVLKNIFVQKKMVLEVKKVVPDDEPSKNKKEDEYILMCDPYCPRNEINYGQMGFRLEAALTKTNIPMTVPEHQDSDRMYFTLSRLAVGDESILVSASIDAFFEEEEIFHPLEIKAVDASVTGSARFLEQGRFQAYTIGGSFLHTDEVLRKEIISRIGGLPIGAELRIDVKSGLTVSIGNRVAAKVKGALEEMKIEEEFGKKWNWGKIDEFRRGPVTFFNIYASKGELRIGYKMVQEMGVGVGKESRFHNKWDEFCDAKNGRGILLKMIDLVKKFKRSKERVIYVTIDTKNQNPEERVVESSKMPEKPQNTFKNRARGKRGRRGGRRGKGGGRGGRRERRGRGRGGSRGRGRNRGGRRGRRGGRTRTRGRGGRRGGRGRGKY